LMVGRRWNVDITDAWNFTDPQWDKKLLMFTHNDGTLYQHDAIDYFVSPATAN
jgi:hypothetical protein